MRQLYSLLTLLLQPIAVAVLLWRGLRNRRYWDHLSERLGFGARLAQSHSVWIHAVSLGEVTAAAPLIRALCVAHPGIPLLLTTATPTGRARALALFGASVTLRYLPYDTPGSTNRFLKRARPRLAIIMETELWPNLYRQCRRRGVPIVLANARLSAKSVARYRRFGALFRELFSPDVLVAAQSAADAARFIAIGAAPERTVVAGNLKFDVVADAAGIARGRDLRSSCWPTRPVWIAGSTHAGEDEIALSAHSQLRRQVSGALLLLVPRHPERFEAVAELLRRRHVRFERRSGAQAVHAQTEVLLVDTVGELAALYAATDVAFVGGSLVPVGGHNLLEPAAMGIPVVTGPYQANAREVADLLVREAAALRVTDAKQLACRLIELLTDPAKRRQMGSNALRVVAQNRGSLGRLLDLIEAALAREPVARSAVDP